MTRNVLAGAAALALLAALALADRATAKKPTDSEELFNPLLGVEYSHWLVGPIAWIASEKEIEEFLSLIDEAEAKAFVADFWQRRNEGTGFFQDTPQELFEQRAVEADKRFTEEAYPGRRSDRGIVLIVYGEPEKIEYESPRRLGDPPLEVWHYAKDAAPGLDGEAPKREYRFIKIDGETVFYTGQRVRQSFEEKMRQEQRRRDY